MRIADLRHGNAAVGFLTGYKPVAVTERITALALVPVLVLVLALVPGHAPEMLVPRLERPDVEHSPAAEAGRSVS